VKDYLEGKGGKKAESETGLFWESSLFGFKMRDDMTLSVIK
jgi:hypothetical protein